MQTLSTLKSVGCTHAAFRRMCKAKGIAVTTVRAELAQRRVHWKSLWGRAYMARRMEELCGRASGTAAKPLPEKARPDAGKRAESHARIEPWLAAVKRAESHARIINGVEEPKLLVDAGRPVSGLVMNEFGAMDLCVNGLAQAHRTDSMQQSATCTALAEVRAEQSALKQIVETVPLPGDVNISDSEVVAMRCAYDTKIANALSGLCLAQGALAKAMCLLETITKKRTLVQCWTVDNAEESATELDNLLRELAVCCERIAKDIFTMCGS